MPPALAELHAEEGTLVTALSGDWSLEQKTPRFETVVAQYAVAGAPARVLKFGASSLGSWDSSLLVFLEDAKADEPEPANFLHRLGSKGIDTWANIESTITFAGEVAIAAAQLPRRGVRMRWREFWVGDATLLRGVSAFISQAGNRGARRVLCGEPYRRTIHRRPGDQLADQDHF